MGILNSLACDDTVIEEKDSLGGYTTLESAVYPMRVKLAFITLSAGKAMALNVHFEGTKKEQLKSQFYMTSGESKGCKNWYINKKTQEKHYLPGFNQANALCLLTVGKEVSSLETSKKVINLYDPEQRKEVPTEVDMLMDLINKDIYAGVLNQLVDKREKDPNTGEYKPTGETRNENEVDKFFRAKDKLTVLEIKAKSKEPAFMNKWVEKWSGIVKDKTAKTNGLPVAAAAAKRQTGSNATTTTMFD